MSTNNALQNGTTLVVDDWHLVIVTDNEGVKKTYIDGKRYLNSDELSAIEGMKKFDLLTPTLA